MYEPDKLFTKEKLPEFSPAVVEMEPWRKALMDAAEIIRARGWCREFHSNGAVCAIGALHSAVGSRPKEVFSSTNLVIPSFSPLWPPQVNEPDERLRKHLGVHSIADWNDAPERTKEDVIRALEECARS